MSKAKVKATKPYMIKNKDPNQLRAALLDGPVVISVDTRGNNWKTYKGGIISNRKTKFCGKQTNHSVLAVGYGFDHVENLPYVKIKNSWGEDWGEGGFARISLSDSDPEGTCGILHELVQAEV